MSLNSVKAASGLQNKALHNVLVELQGLTRTMLTGTTANTTIALAAIRQEDTVFSAIDWNAGVPTDITNTITINDCHASGTVTAASVTAADTVTVDGRVYTAVANGATLTTHQQFSVGASDNACAANLAAAINLSERDDTTSSVNAVAVGAVVTITARTEGTGGNSITLATSNNTRLAKSGTTLAGGTATGGIKSTAVTHYVDLMWYNKNP